MQEERLALVTGSFTACQACLNGEGGECHSPGCLFFLCRAPDLPIGETLRMSGVCVDEEWDLAKDDSRGAR